LLYTHGIKLTVLGFNISKVSSRREGNKVLKGSSNNKMKGIMAYTEDPIVSSDIIGESHSSIVDGLSTMVIGERAIWLKSCHGMTMNGVLLAD